MPINQENQFTEFDRFINRVMKDWLAPGVGIGIIQNKKISYLQSYGYRDLKKQLPITRDTRFCIASCSKSFTATAIGILVDEKKLEWDRPVKAYLPSFRMYDPVMTSRMTVRDLMCHRSGLPRHDNTWFNNPISKIEIAKRLQFLEPTRTGADNPYDFRNKYQYNNLMFIMAGILIEKISGISFEEFVTDRILKPIGMHQTRFYTNDLMSNPDFATSYSKSKKRLYPYLRGWMKEVGGEQLFGPTAPAGGIVSTIPDVCKWLIFQMNQGKLGRTQVISESSLKELHTPQFINPPVYSYPERLNACAGLGWMIESYRGERLVRHSGNLGGFSTHMSFIPERNLGIVMSTNIGVSPLDPIIPLSLYDRILGLKPVDWNQRKKLESKKEDHDLRIKQKKDFKHKVETKPSKPLPAYAGIYQHPGYGKIIITFDRGKLELEYNGAQYQLIHLEKDSFKMIELLPGGDKYKVSFAISKPRKIESIHIPFEPSVQDIVFKRKG
ncbi:MAG: serine hydrolase [bacterium]